MLSLISLPARHGRIDGRKAGGLHSPEMNLSQLRENLLKPAVDRLESCLGPGDGGPAGRAANRHPGPVRHPAILGGRNQCEAGSESGLWTEVDKL